MKCGEKQAAGCRLQAIPSPSRRLSIPLVRALHSSTAAAAPPPPIKLTAATSPSSLPAAAATRPAVAASTPPAVSRTPLTRFASSSSSTTAAFTRPAASCVPAVGCIGAPWACRTTAREAASTARAWRIVFCTRRGKSFSSCCWNDGWRG